jgi:hypothetical protein
MPKPPLDRAAWPPGRRRAAFGASRPPRWAPGSLGPPGRAMPSLGPPRGLGPPWRAKWPPGHLGAPIGPPGRLSVANSAAGLARAAASASLRWPAGPPYVQPLRAVGATARAPQPVAARRGWAPPLSPPSGWIPIAAFRTGRRLAAGSALDRRPVANPGDVARAVRAENAVLRATGLILQHPAPPKMDKEQGTTEAERNSEKRQPIHAA